MMNKIRIVLRNGFIAGLVMLLVGVMPVPAFAQENNSETNNTSSTEQITEQSQPAPVEKPATGTTGPTGAASWTYWYNEGTGLWENDYYTYNPSTRETVPKTPLEYTYNPVSGVWDTEVWQYSASAGAYRQTTISVTAPPAGAVTHGGPADIPSAPEVQEPVAQAPSENSPADAPNSTTQNAQKSSNLQATKNASATGHTHANGGSLTFSNSGTITNYLTSTAQSGNATVIANTTAGNAASGDASSMANIINLLQSQSSLGAPGMATFTANIQGNVQGDFLIDPAQLVQPAGQSGSTLSNLEVNAKNEGQINNDVVLNANSGNVSAEKNTTVGNVTSGDASAIANVVNMINSVVAANQSFMGVINIHGDYTGNILMPTESLNALLASSGSQPATSATVNNTSTQSIHNDIDLTADSGNATSSQNTTSGNVTSGDALTNLTLLNLTGRQVVAANSLLVFVNVLGSWVGLIMDAPAGTTSAALGGGVGSDTTAALAGTAAINNTENFGINNKITAKASSGNASAKQNTSAGDVTSGDATASANVANIVNSQFSLSNWFGVLFINVFGTWRGDFGVAKPPVVQPITSGVAGPASGAASVGAKDMRIFAFTPKISEANGAEGGNGQTDLQLSPLSEAQQTGNVRSSEMLERVSKVLSSGTGKSVATGQTAATANQADFNWSGIMLALGIAGFGAVGVDRVRTNLRNRKFSTKD